MEFKKERNFIVCYDASKVQGSWNITTGEFCGKSGNPVKRVPSCFSYNHLGYADVNDLSSAIRFYRESFATNSPFNYNGQRFEELISLGLFPQSITDLYDNTKLDKNLVDYLKEKYRGVYSKSAVKMYMIDKVYADKLANFPDYGVLAFHNIILYNPNMPVDYIINALTRAIMEHAEYLYKERMYNSYYTSLSNMVVDYYEYSMALYGEVKVNKNFMTTLGNLTFLYIKYKEEHTDDLIKRYNDNKTLYFKNDEFFVRPLLSREDFHIEATAQNNCVERLYMEKVVNKVTHVVVVREKSNPDKPFITCEVTSEGNICQFLHKNNNRYLSESEKIFRNLYQNHLNDNFKESA